MQEISIEEKYVMNHKFNSKESKVSSKYLWIFLLIYCFSELCANMVDARMIQWGSIILDGGAFIFPMTYLTSNIITEVYGRDNARKAILLGFIFNLIFIIYCQILRFLPSPTGYNVSQAFDTVTNASTRIIIASLISYLISEPLDSYILSKLKVRDKGRKMLKRFILSSCASSASDSIIFGVLAFAFTLNNHDLFIYIAEMWCIKVFVEILCLIPSIWVSIKMKEIEQIDILDNRMPFRPFGINDKYTQEDNYFRKNL